MIKYRFEGGRELEQGIGQLDKWMTRRNVGWRMLEAAARPILSRWRARVNILTGTLFRSLVIGRRLNRRQSGFARAVGKADLELHIGTNDPAGIMEEFGMPHQAANPAGRAAWDAEGGQAALDRMATAGRAELATVAAKLEAQAKRAAAKKTKL